MMTRQTRSSSGKRSMDFDNNTNDSENSEDVNNQNVEARANEASYNHSNQYSSKCPLSKNRSENTHNQEVSSESDININKDDTNSKLKECNPNGRPTPPADLTNNLKKDGIENQVKEANPSSQFFPNLLKKGLNYNYSRMLVPVFLSVCIYFFLSYFGNWDSQFWLLLTGGSSQGKSNFELNDKIDHLEMRFPMLSSKVWITLTACLTSILNNAHPCIILFLNDGKQDFSDFLNDIGELSKEVFSEIDTKSDIIKIKGSKLPYEADNFFNWCKSELEEQKIIIVDEMERVPGNIIELFHSFCDIYDPAVKQSVIIFMLNHQNNDVQSSKNDATFAIDILSDLWKDSIHEDIITPLAIRVCENVLRL